MAKHQVPTHIRISKEQAATLSMGDKISLAIKGVVTGVQEREHFEIGEPGQKQTKSEKFIELELEDTTVTEISGNQADKDLKEQSKQSGHKER